MTFIGANKVLSTYFVFTLIDDYVSWTWTVIVDKYESFFYIKFISHSLSVMSENIILFYRSSWVDNSTTDI